MKPSLTNHYLTLAGCKDLVQRLKKRLKGKMEINGKNIMWVFNTSFRVEKLTTVLWQEKQFGSCHFLYSCSNITGNFPCSPVAGEYNYLTVSEDPEERGATMCYCQRECMGLEKR